MTKIDDAAVQRFKDALYSMVADKLVLTDERIKHGLEAVLSKLGPICGAAKIDDAMIERSWQAWPIGETPKVIIQRILEAALTPQEPEIPVSEGMKDAGANEIKSLGGTNHRAMRHGLHLATYPIETVDAVGIYKAMERVRRKEAGEGGGRKYSGFVSAPAGGHSHYRVGDVQHYHGHTQYGHPQSWVARPHRRKDDPK